MVPIEVPTKKVMVPLTIATKPHVNTELARTLRGLDKLSKLEMIKHEGLTIIKQESATESDLGCSTPTKGAD